MSKKPKAACAHGLKPITVSGCPHCVQNALYLAYVCERLGCDGGELVDAIAEDKPTWGHLQDAVTRAKERKAAKEAKG